MKPYLLALWILVIGAAGLEARARRPPPLPVLDLSNIRCLFVRSDVITGVFVMSGPAPKEQLPFRAYWLERNQAFELVVGTFPRENVNVFGFRFTPKTMKAEAVWWFPVSYQPAPPSPLERILRFVRWPWGLKWW